MKNLPQTANEKTPRLTEILTSEELSLINNPESEEAKRYVSEHLNEDERRIITTGCCDEIIIAIIDNMKLNQPERMDYLFLNNVVKPEWQREYILSQKPWIITNEEVTHESFSMEKYRMAQNHKRHRLLYLICYPERFNEEWDEEYGGRRSE